MFRMTFAAAGLVLAISTAGAALAQPIAVVVEIKTPPPITRPILEGEFRKAAPTYQKIPGLIRKYFTVTGDTFGGIYLWKDRAAAEAWFSDAWRARAKAAYGSEPTVSYYDAPLIIEGVNPGGAR